MSERIIGPYRLEQPIGRGGMGEVWRAVDTKLNRVVALKLLPPSLSPDSAFRERFIRESQIVARVIEPHIVPIYAAGEIDGQLYIAMQLIDGEDLSALVARSGPLSAERAVDIISQVARALDAAHKQGIVHRDIKPSNITLAQSTDGSDHAYLLDFGIATMAAAGNQTITGVAVGTLAYMAPERFSGSRADHRSDIYGLACVLYQALTGHPPFTGESAPALLHAHLNLTPEAVTRQRPGLPIALDSVLATGLAKNPDRRQQSAGQFAADARAALLSPPAPVGSPPTWTRTGGFAPATGFAPVAIAPLTPEEQRAEHEVISVPLAKNFRFVHEPMAYRDVHIPSLGNESLVQSVFDRIRRSDGGALLLGGFRGAGKTTVVEHALGALVELDDQRRYVTIKLSLARPITSNELLFAIVRRLFERLEDSGLLKDLPSETRRSILLAYVRTSMSLADKRSEGRETTRTLGVSGTLGIMPGLRNFAPKAERSSKTSRTTATEAAFLAYSDSDVEHDFLRIIELLRGGHRPANWFARLIRRTPPAPIHVLVVLDELDKLTAVPGGEESLETMIGTLKNIFSTSGIHILFVAGVDLLDRALKDYHRGLGLFESVFAWNVYVPCLWKGPERLLERLISRDDIGVDDFELLLNYLRYKGRGLSRRLFQDLNGLVRFDDSGPRLAVGRREEDAFRLYAELTSTLDAYLGDHAEEHSTLDDDRFRLGAFYVMDWLLRSEGAVVTAADVVSGERSLSPLLRQSEHRVASLLRFLAERDVLERMSSSPGRGTVISDLPPSGAALYRLAPALRRRLDGIQRLGAQERAAFGGQSVPVYNASAASAPSPPPPNGLGHAKPGEARRLANGRYELLDLLGIGTVSSVYLARDNTSGELVAARVLNEAHSQRSPALRDRFLRQADLAAELDHPGVVRTHQVIREPDMVAVITDLVHGRALGTAIANRLLQVSDAVRVAAGILDIVDHLHENGLVRLDLKPTNFVLRDGLNPVLTDMTLARPIDKPAQQFATTPGVVLGTPLYMAPELGTADSAGSVDGRADVYAAGVILFEMLVSAVHGESLEVWAPRGPDTRAIDRLDVSAELADLLKAALATAPSERLDNAKVFRERLGLVPEFLQPMPMPMPEPSPIPPTDFVRIPVTLTDVTTTADTTTNS